MVLRSAVSTVAKRVALVTAAQVCILINYLTKFNWWDIVGSKGRETTTNRDARIIADTVSRVTRFSILTFPLAKR
jgi:hypothetical protein